MSSMLALRDKLRNSRGFAHKQDICAIAGLMASAAPSAFPNGDDCAVIPDSNGHLLFAIEGFLNDFVKADPWFAGYCGVMVNASDVYAMGGRPVALVDAVWSDGTENARLVLTGLLAAAARYGIPVVGGHTNCRNSAGQLAAAILGRAKALLSSFEAKPGQHLIAAIDLRGHYREPYPYWDASTSSPAERLRQDLELLPEIAEAGLSCAAKDISMGGILGSALMLLESSGIGARVALPSIPCPAGVPLDRWLSTFPSYGFILSVDQRHLAQVLALFARRDIAAATIGTTDSSGILRISDGREEIELWNLRESPLIGFTKALEAAAHA